MTPIELLAEAKRLLDRADARVTGIWPRAAALLARQALEQGLTEYWSRRGVRLTSLATRPQLICLSTYLRDGDLAARVSHVWSLLTLACHHHAYDLPPSLAELQAWIGTIDGLVLAAASCDGADRGQVYATSRRTQSASR